MSQSTGLFPKEGDMVTIFGWDNDQLLVSWEDADTTQYEGGCVDLRGACDAISRSRVHQEAALTLVCKLLTGGNTFRSRVEMLTQRHKEVASLVCAALEPE